MDLEVNITVYWRGQCTEIKVNTQINTQNVNKWIWCHGSSDRSFMVDPLSYFSFQPMLYDWCNKGRGMCYPVCGMVHIKEPLLLIGKSSPCGGSGFPLSLSKWSFTICQTPYNGKWNVLSTSLNKTFPFLSFPLSLSEWSFTICQTPYNGK